MTTQGDHMERHALLFRVKPGTEDAVAAILAAYRRPPTQIDADTRLLGTTVLMHGNFVVRTMEIEGGLPKVVAHLARRPEIQAAERELNPYLELPRDLGDPQAARAFFQRSAMRLVIHRGPPALPPGLPATRHALLYPLRPGSGEEAEAVFVGGGDPPHQAGATRLLRTTVFRHADTAVRLFDIVGDLDEAIDHLVRATALQQAGRGLASYLADGIDISDEAGLRRFFADQLMTVVTDRRAAQAA
jgi:hypothetical protein